MVYCGVLVRRARNRTPYVASNVVSGFGKAQKPYLVIGPPAAPAVAKKKNSNALPTVSPAGFRNLLTGCGTVVAHITVIAVAVGNKPRDSGAI